MSFERAVCIGIAIAIVFLLAREVDRLSACWASIDAPTDANLYACYGEVEGAHW